MVEGASDCNSLEFIDKLNNDNAIKFYSTNGDITSKKGVNSQNCIKEINNHLNDFIKRKNLKKSDIIKIIHILDTDGVYIPENKIIEDNNAPCFIYTAEGIIAPSKENVIARNKNKKEVLEKLLITSEISSVSYSMYYMSCNLEHVLHNRLENFTDEEKKELSDKFADSFYEREKEFIDFINNPAFKVLGDYKTTWDFIKQNLNSVNRYCNLWLFFS